jgi:hypothetical protein
MSIVAPAIRNSLPVNGLAKSLTDRNKREVNKTHRIKSESDRQTLGWRKERNTMGNNELRRTCLSEQAFPTR